MVQGHFLAQRLLIEVLAQIWGRARERGRKKGSAEKAVIAGLNLLILSTRWQCTSGERVRHQAQRQGGWVGRVLSSKWGSLGEASVGNSAP